MNYLEWLASLVDIELTEHWHFIFDTLNKIDFYYTHPLDENRVSDGLALRFDYAEQTGASKIQALKDNRPCSFLEMLVALCFRAGTQVISNPHDLFIMVMDNLHLFDQQVDETFIINQVHKALNHVHDYDGSNGGLFVLPGIDITQDDYWKQVMKIGRFM